MIEHEGRCDDHGEGQPCAICRGDISNEFVERMKAVAVRPGRTMTAEEFIAWLDGLGTGPSHLG